MATLIGDVFTDSSSRFHNMIGGPGIQHQRPHDIYQNHAITRSHDIETQAHHQRATANTQFQTRKNRKDWEDSPVPSVVADNSSARQTPTHRALSAGGATRLPSPPSSSSSSSETSTSGAGPQQHDIPSDGAHNTANRPSSATASSASSMSTTTTIVAAPKAMPSPDSDSGPRWGSSSNAQVANAPSIPLGLNEPPSPSIQPPTIVHHVRDLAHLQTLAKADLLTSTGTGILNGPPLQQMKYEISAMPISDIIEMVAALLTKITTTNDLQHDALNRNAHHLRQAQAQARKDEAGTDGNMSPLSSSVLAFHGKNVPSISILSYLSRIHKYCPTTYEVFLSLLVYFDRMTERVNDLVMKSEEAKRQQADVPSAQQTATAKDADTDTVMRDDDDEDDEMDDSDETDSDLADTDAEDSPGGERKGSASNRKDGAAKTTGQSTQAAAAQATYFVVDSYNIHRLIIAGVTCASKFFSDVFYTNSRYAKVGGLPLQELNHLELQFLLLNDFRLAVPVEDLEAYATMLVEFYTREVVSQRSRPAAGGE
ncbi:cyclin-domain-containing protein [Podospora australis]|uniref:Cyclin-domain-containing protein n=1 Tax=Podospora australis TaxID=1536484 RepID=A0AAN6X2F0_9PEZI|nr:cyclin-domain-containing protein [Podospora australis]